MIDLEKILADTTYYSDYFKEYDGMVSISDCLSAMREACEKTVNEMGNEILNKCQEHIKSGGLRFYGVSHPEIMKTLIQYGYKENIPF